MTSRRNCLKTAAALGSSLALPALAQPGAASAAQAAASGVAAPRPRPPAAPASPQAAAPAPAVPPLAAQPPRAWQNWSGLQRCEAAWLLPTSEEQLAASLPALKGPLRCVGAGHSFTALVPTPGTLISLDRLSGIVEVDKAAMTVRVKAGTRLGALARELDAQGLALHNQPDIDVQTLAGALSTGTHGTGLTLPALHAEIQALRLLTPQGEVKVISRLQNAELFDAARVSLGALGIITEYTLRVRPRYMLRRKVWLERTEALLERAPALAREHRHFELYVLPFTGYAAGITHIEVPEGPPERPHSADEDVLADLQKLRDWLGRWPQMRRWAAAKLIDPAQTELAQDWSHKLLSTARPTRFNETEYHLPREQGLPCLRAVVAQLEKRNEVFFPLEFRWVRADHAWLSPFFERDSCSVAVHAKAGEAHDYLLGEIGPIFQRHGGRPHWGKLHTLTARELTALYPRFKDFQQLREQLDPQGRLLNAHLQQVFTGGARG
ncbi:D-arabinono-1,4-lactone oxidase [Pelomonas sp. APW6]|uniref:D-arabinono-1,4-lactone oxidase n=1 Tax=Roseateles subflavus TaxID=3053353 RepID=A0ABT7LFH6_9BURK|nr:D-arabinono-1,4-lactone oxidase [Pelomonas sp. APW6]MDL5031593.1 D-arabinono-1,4-lactone oxidase [Pelomonas sp. APW6]